MRPFFLLRFPCVLSDSLSCDLRPARLVAVTRPPSEATRRVDEDTPWFHLLLVPTGFVGSSSTELGWVILSPRHTALFPCYKPRRKSSATHRCRSSRRGISVIGPGELGKCFFPAGSTLLPFFFSCDRALSTSTVDRHVRGSYPSSSPKLRCTYRSFPSPHPFFFIGSRQELSFFQDAESSFFFLFLAV